MNKFIKIGSIGYAALSILSLLYVSLLAWVDPKDVMKLVDVTLPNTDSISSIRGVYGGVGISLVVMVSYFTKRDLVTAVSFLTLFWGLYATSRIITIFVDGPLGEFGNTWVWIESVYCIVGIVLLLLSVSRRPGLLRSAT